MSSVSKFPINVRKGMSRGKRARVKAALRPLLSADDLVGVITRDVRPNERFARAVGDEVFLRQITLPYVASHYLGFLPQRGFSDNIEFNEIAREIAMTLCKNKEFYLRESSFCWIGYLLHPTVPIPKGFPRSSGDLINCGHNLLKEDPELRQNPNLDLMPSKGIVALITTPDAAYEIPEDVFNTFVRKAREDKPFLSLHHKHIRTMREMLRFVYEQVRQISPERMSRLPGTNLDFQRINDLGYIFEGNVLKRINLS